MTAAAPALVHVRIGQLAAGSGSTVLKATLGSCVGIALLWRERSIYALAHCLLPQAAASAPTPTSTPGARYVDQAIDSLLGLLGAGPGDHAHIDAHLAGGASLQRGRTEGRSPTVGQLNSEAALRGLAAAGIGVRSTDLGGIHARQILLDCAAGAVSVVRIPLP